MPVPVFGSREDVKALIVVSKDEKIQEQIGSAKKRNTHVYRRISKILRVSRWQLLYLKFQLSFGKIILICCEFIFHFCENRIDISLRFAFVFILI